MGMFFQTSTLGGWDPFNQMGAEISFNLTLEFLEMVAYGVESQLFRFG